MYDSKILVLDDDDDIRQEVCEALELEGFSALGAANGTELRKMALEHDVALFILDLVLPGENGLAIAKSIRDESDVGIIIVTGRSGEADRVVGLELGADDYVTKPFSPRELLARVKSVLRRTSRLRQSADEVVAEVESELVRFDGWVLDLNSRELIAPDGSKLHLTTAEFELLNAFTGSPRRVLSRDYLLDRVYGLDWVGYERGIDGLVSRLRRKIRSADPEFARSFVKSVRGVGYMFTSLVHR